MSSKVPDRAAKARRTFQARFEQQADPFGILPPEERQRRATELRSEWFRQLVMVRWGRAKARKGNPSDRDE